mgnify:CR=1 FL=1
MNTHKTLDIAGLEQVYDALRELGWEGRGRPVVLGLLATITANAAVTAITQGPQVIDVPERPALYA